MKKITAFWIITTIFLSCNKDNYSQCLEGKVIWGNCAGSYIQILSKRSPIENKVAFGSKGSISYKEVNNVFFTDTIPIRGDSTSQTFIFQLQPFVKGKKAESGPCQLLIDVNTLKGTLENYSVAECN